MKKFILTSLLLLSLTISGPKESKAFVGVILSSNPVTLTGMIVTGVAITPGMICIHRGGCDTADALIAAILFYYGGLAGVIILDSEHGQRVKLTQLNHDMALDMDISEEEMKSFNDEIVEINMVKDYLASDVLTKAKAGANFTVEDILVRWDEHKEELSPLAVNAVKKIILSNNEKSLEAQK